MHKKNSLHLNSFFRFKKFSLGTAIALSFLAGMFLSFYISGILRFSSSSSREETKGYPSTGQPASLQPKSVSDFLSARKKNASTEKGENHSFSSRLKNIEKGSSIESFKLTGTIISDRKKMAVFEDQATHKQTILKKGERLDNFTVADIRRKSVLLELGRIPGNIKLENTAPHDEKNNENTLSVIKRIGPHHFEVDKRIMMANLKDPAKFLKQVRLVPFVSDGKSGGFILKNMKNESFLKDIGLMEGDIVTRINGENLDDTFTAIRQFASLGEQDSVYIELSRDNAHITLKYTLR